MALVKVSLSYFKAFLCDAFVKVRGLYFKAFLCKALVKARRFYLRVPQADLPRGDRGTGEGKAFLPSSTSG